MIVMSRPAYDLALGLLHEAWDGRGYAFVAMVVVTLRTDPIWFEREAHFQRGWDFYGALMLRRGA